MFNKLFPVNSKRRKFMKRMFPKIAQNINHEEIAYRKWRKANLPTKAELKAQTETKFEIMPKISIIVPVYNTPEKFFKELIECMKNQTYSNWELCLADGSPTPLEFRDKYIADEPRVKYKTIDENKGISGNTNEALSLATGDYIGLLDHDDYLPEYSLFEVVKAINENPDVEFIYTDEDKFEEVGKKHYGVFFKPDFFERPRRPLLVIYPVELKAPSEIRNPEELQQHSAVINTKNVLIGISVGIPAIKGRELKRYQYKINLVMYRELMGSGEYEPDETHETTED